MKRSLKIFSLLLVLMIMLTGCFKKDAKATFEDALKNMEDIKGATAKFDTNVEMSAEGNTLSMGLGLKGDFSNEDANPNGHYTVSLNIFGMDQETEMYITAKDGYAYNYTKTQDGWTYTKTPIEENLDKMDALEFLSYIKDVKEKDGIYTVTLNKNKLNELLKKEEFKSAVEETGFNEIKEDLVFTAKIENGYVTYLEIDIAKLVKSITGETTIEGTSISGKIAMSLSNINKVNKISIPEEVTKNAKEQVEEIDEI